MKRYSDGSIEWLLNGLYHRTDGPACEYSNGTKIWYLNGERHRENGPAYDCLDGTKHWYLNGKYHRVDAPAIERPDGTKEWCLSGRFYNHIKGKLHNNNFLTSDQYIGPVIIAGGKNKIKFMKTIDDRYLVIETNKAD